MGKLRASNERGHYGSGIFSLTFARNEDFFLGAVQRKYKRTSKFSGHFFSFLALDNRGEDCSAFEPRTSTIFFRRATTPRCEYLITRFGSRGREGGKRTPCVYLVIAPSRQLQPIPFLLLAEDAALIASSVHLPDYF